jgi:hypothetical protein
VARSRPDTLTGLRTADRWLTFANVLEIVAAVLAVLVVRKVSEALDAAGRQGMTPAMAAPAPAWLPPETVQPATFWQPDVADAGPPAGPSGPEAVQPKPVWLSDAAPAAPFAEPEPAAPEYSEPPATGSVPPPGWAQSG